MKGDLFIDDIDAYERFGTTVMMGGWDQILSFPDMGKVETNNWPEENGLEVDLSHPILTAKNVGIPFGLDKSKEKENLISHLMKPGYHVFRIPKLEREWSYRMKGFSNLKLYDGIMTFTLNFSEDHPIRPTLSTPQGSSITLPKSSYSLDGVPFGNFGVVVIAGRNELYSYPSLKKTLTRVISIKDGMEYDTGNVKFDGKDISLKCMFCCKSVAEFWRAYDSFFYALIQPNERILTTNYINGSIHCYYKKSSSWKLEHLSSDRMFVSFTLTLCVTDKS